MALYKEALAEKAEIYANFRRDRDVLEKAVEAAKAETDSTKAYQIVRLLNPVPPFFTDQFHTGAISHFSASWGIEPISLSFEFLSFFISAKFGVNPIFLCLFGLETISLIFEFVLFHSR